MAAPNNISNLDYSNRKIRLLMNKLRDSGQEYVNNKGLLIPAKEQPTTFCMCPQQCSKKLKPKEKFTELFQQFYQLEDQNIQNKFLQSHIEIKPVMNYPTEKSNALAPNKRRVTCKYYIPDLPDTRLRTNCLKNYIMARDTNGIQVCQRAFMSVYGISEKRLRMQRERKIALGEFKKNLKDSKKPSKMEEGSSLNNDEEMDICQEQPLDLSNPVEKAINSIEIDKTSLYQIAEALGMPKKLVDQEMASQYEALVRENLRKHQKKIDKQRRLNELNNKRSSLKGISEQVVGLEDHLTILPIQTLNDGDLTITPVLGSENKQVENKDIMKVNIFFQNQLWKPEYLGIPVGLGTSTVN